jgi:hypothetical protein
MMTRGGVALRFGVEVFRRRFEGRMRACPADITSEQVSQQIVVAAGRQRFEVSLGMNAAKPMAMCCDGNRHLAAVARICSAV